MVLAGGNKTEEEAESDGVVGSVDRTLPDAVVVEVADRPENLKISDFDHGCVAEGGGVDDLDVVVVGPTLGGEGDGRVELHFEGSAVDDAGVGSVEVVVLVRVLDVVEVGLVVAAGGGGVGHGG